MGPLENSFASEKLFPNSFAMNSSSFNDPVSIRRWTVDKEMISLCEKVNTRLIFPTTINLLTRFYDHCHHD